MNLSDLTNQELAELYLYDRILTEFEREQVILEGGTDLSKISAFDLMEIIEYGRILTPTQREVIAAHKRWLADSIETEDMDHRRETWNPYDREVLP